MDSDSVERRVDRARRVLDAFSGVVVVAGVVIHAETDLWWPAVASLGVIALFYGLFLVVLWWHRRAAVHRVDTSSSVRQGAEDVGRS